jgi:protein-S-isoprenylcysteine O-methyltransferase Ste14
MVRSSRAASCSAYRKFLEQRWRANSTCRLCPGFWPGPVALGLGFAVAARAWLGRNWSAEVTIKQNHELVRSGPYTIVRHLIYTGMLLELVGTALSVGKWRALVGLVLIVAALLRKLSIEERFMSEQFGEAYARYRAEVPGLIPFVI